MIRSDLSTVSSRLEINMKFWTSVTCERIVNLLIIGAISLAVSKNEIVAILKMAAMITKNQQYAGLTKITAPENESNAIKMCLSG